MLWIKYSQHLIIIIHLSASILSLVVRCGNFVLHNHDQCPFGYALRKRYHKDQKQQTPVSICSQGFEIVAEAGLEPTTFGL